MERCVSLFYDDTSEWAVMNRIYRGLNPLVGTINNIRDITHAFVNHLYEDGTYLYPPKDMNVDYWNTHLIILRFPYEE